jgi:hypothetical protein
MGFYPVAVYYNKKQHKNNTHHTQTNTAHKTTQTIKDTLHTMNIMQIGMLNSRTYGVTAFNAFLNCQDLKF